MEDFKKKIDDFSAELNTLSGLLKLEDKRKGVEAIQAKMSAPGFWDDQKESAKVVSDLKVFKSDLEAWDALKEKLDELKELIGVADESYEQEILKEIASFEPQLEKLRLAVLFSGRFDDCNAIVEINSGAGGTESCDWASMLYRMYFRWAQDKGFSVSVLEELRGEEAGIKNVTFLIEGLRAYGLLRSERGVHRLVRVSPFDANKRRHTSFASVDVIPEIKEDIDIQIKPEDLEVDTFRSGGAGGQNVNKTESAIRITHLPSGIIVSCQIERSQHQNRLFAMRVLKAKLYELKEEERKKTVNGLSGEKRKIEWGSQIRSYVLYPYLLAKDHRTDHEDRDSKTVLDGRLDDFIYSYLKWSKQ
jgi:peptide chain release factor 2